MKKSSQHFFWHGPHEGSVQVLGYARIVADAFSDVTGNDWTVGDQSLAYQPIVIDTLPADLVLQVVASSSELRSADFDAIRDRLQDEVMRWSRARIEVFINFVDED